MNMVNRISVFIFVVFCNYVSGYLRVCYYTNWSQYRPNGGKFTPENIQPNLCSHIIFAFGKLEGNNIVPFEWNDDSTDLSVGMYAKVNNMKKRNRQLRTLLAMGGWNAGSLPFSDMAATAGNRKAFVNSTIHYLRQRNFDGLDMDWEYPAKRGGRPGDKNNLVLLLSELKQAFEQESYHTGKPRLLLTAAVPAGKSNIDAGFDIPNVVRSLDFINIMTYDMHGSWEPRTGHNSPLYGRAGETVEDATLNMDWTARYWVQQGAPKHKLIIGFGVYGRSFQLETVAANGLGATSIGPGTAGKYTREAGFMAYFEVCDELKKGATRVWNNEQKVPYIHNGDMWVGYDDEESIKEKIKWLKQNNYGGAMIWSLALDDFSGTFCNKGRYPLLRTINRELRQKKAPAPVEPTTSVHQTAPADTTFISTLDVPTPKHKRSGHSQVPQLLPGGQPSFENLNFMTGMVNDNHTHGSHGNGHLMSTGSQVQSRVQMNPVRHHSPNGHANVIMQSDPLSGTIPHDAQSIILPPEVTNALLGNLSHADSQFPILVGLDHHPPPSTNVVIDAGHAGHGPAGHSATAAAAGHSPIHIVDGAHPQSVSNSALNIVPATNHAIVVNSPAAVGSAGVIMDAPHGGHGHLPAAAIDLLPPSPAAIALPVDSQQGFQIMNSPVAVGLPQSEVVVAPPTGVVTALDSSPGSVISSLVRAAGAPSSGINLSFSRSSSSSSNSNSSSSNSSSSSRNINILPAGRPFSSPSVVGDGVPAIVQQGRLPVVAVDSGVVVESPVSQDAELLSLFGGQGLPGEMSISPGSPGTVIPMTSIDSLAHFLQDIPTDGNILLPPEEIVLSSADILRELTIPGMMRGIRTSPVISRRPTTRRLVQPSLTTRSALGSTGRTVVSNQGSRPGSTRVVSRGGRTITASRPRVTGTTLRTRPVQRRLMPQTRTQGLGRPLRFQRRQMIPPSGTRTRLPATTRTARTPFRFPVRIASRGTQGRTQFTTRTLPQQRRTVRAPQPRNNILLIGSPSRSARQLSDIQNRINGNIRMLPWS